MQFFKIEMMCESQHQVTKFKSDFMKCFQSLFFHTNTCKRRKKIWKQGGGEARQTINTISITPLMLWVNMCRTAALQWNAAQNQKKSLTRHPQRSSAFADINKHVGRQRMEKTGWNAGMPPWVALPIPRRKQPCPDTVRQKESSSSSSSHPAAGDSCAILAGCRTTMPPSFKSFPNKRKHWLVNQTEGRREKDEGGGPVPLRFTLAHLHLLLFILNKYYSAKSQRT